MIGSLFGTDRMFRKDGYTGVESTFGLGHTTDGASYDGVLFQWQRLSYQADAQMAGNAYATSIECADGGKIIPFSAKQVEASIDLGVWWCKQTGNPARKATAWNGTGLGYHRMFKEWAPDGRSCPGDPRVRQLENEIWPEIARRLGGATPVTPPTPPVASVAPKFPLAESEYYGLKHNAGIPDPEKGLRQWQQQMKNRGWTITPDGQFGPETDSVTRAFQREKRLGVDGRVGLQTWNAAWHAKVT
jgi:hypothetical protein